MVEELWNCSAWIWIVGMDMDKKFVVMGKLKIVWYDFSNLQVFFSSNVNVTYAHCKKFRKM